MSSAAVIGRQLRQQQNFNRVPGPVVPPTQYRGRSIPPLNSLSANDKFDFLIGADADKKFAKFSQQYSSNSHDFYPHPAHRQKKDKRSAHGKTKKKKESTITFSKHCFCVAFKALSIGVILLIVGTIMSILGFFADSLSLEQTRLDNGTLVSTINKDTKQHLHNMTYVGPVIMGLGGIVVVAACVLTFEVRDTLGIKNDPNKNRTNSIEKPTAINVENGKNSIKMSQKIYQHGANPIMNNNKLQLPDTNAIVPQMKPNYTNESNALVKSTLAGFSNDLTATLTTKNNQQNDRLSNISINSTELSYCQIPSPVDIELSDPEGCSLDLKWRSRCSCSGSLTNSMSLALHKSADTNENTAMKMMASIDDLSYRSNESELFINQPEQWQPQQKINSKFYADHPSLQSQSKFNSVKLKENSSTINNDFLIDNNVNNNNNHHHQINHCTNQNKYPLLRLPE